MTDDDPADLADPADLVDRVVLSALLGCHPVMAGLDELGGGSFLDVSAAVERLSGMAWSTDLATGSA